MPGRQLPAFPGAPEHVFRVALGERKYVVRFRWRWRLRAWFADVEHDDGAVVVKERRVSPGYALARDLNVEGDAGDALMVFGADGYAREELGTTLRVVHFLRSELELTVADTDAPVIVVA